MGEKARSLLALQAQIARLTRPPGTLYATVDVMASGAGPVTARVNGYQAWTLRLALQAQHASESEAFSRLLANPPAAAGLPAFHPATDTTENQPPGESLSGGQETT